MEDRKLFYVILLNMLFVIAALRAPVVNENQMPEIIGSHDYVLLFFFLENCSHSISLAPIYDDLYDRVQTEMEDSKKVFIGKVNVGLDDAYANRKGVLKVPTFRIIRYGVMAKQEYRSMRTAEGLWQYLQEQIDPRIITLDDKTNPALVANYSTFVIGKFAQQHGPLSGKFERMASVYREQCTFFRTNHENVQPQIQMDSIAFGNKRAPGQVDNGDFTLVNVNPQDLEIVVQKFCRRYVVELTVDNVEEYAEQDLPMVVLLDDYNSSDHKQTMEKYVDLVRSEPIKKYSEGINFVYGDADTFKRALVLTNKEKKDLPLIAIDDKRHIYPYPGSLSDVREFEEFLASYQNHTLHQKLHEHETGVPVRVSYIIIRQPGSIRILQIVHTGLPEGFDEVLNGGLPGPADQYRQQLEFDGHFNQNRMIGDSTPVIDGDHVPTWPDPIPDGVTKHERVGESVFGRLKPSDKRYTLLSKDEL